MHKKSGLWITRLRVPGQQLCLIGMVRKAANSINVRTHRDVFTRIRTRSPVRIPDPAMMTAPPSTRLFAIDSDVSQVKCGPGRSKGSAP